LEPRKSTEELDCISHRNRRKAKLKIAPAELKYGSAWLGMFICGVLVKQQYLSNQSFEPPTLTGASGIKKYPGLQHYQRGKKNMAALVHVFPFKTNN